MKQQLLNDGQEKRYVLVFDPGEEVMAALAEFAERNEITAASFTAIGAFSRLVFAWFDPESKEYRKTPLNEQVEVLSIVGNVAMYQDKPRLHAHVVVAGPDGVARGGHLFEGHVRPTLEVTLVQSSAYLRRGKNETTGLPTLLQGD